MTVERVLVEGYAFNGADSDGDGDGDGDGNMDSRKTISMMMGCGYRCFGSSPKRLQFDLRRLLYISQ